MIKKALAMQKYGMGQWWRDLTLLEAESIGRQALLTALRTFDPSKNPRLETHAVNVICGAISDAVRQAQREKLRNAVRLDAPQQLNPKRLEHERIGTATPNFDSRKMERLQALLDLHRRGDVPASDPAIYALTHIYRHSAYEMAPVIGSSRHAIELLQKRIERRAEKAVRKTTQLQAA